MRLAVVHAGAAHALLLHLGLHLPAVLLISLRCAVSAPAPLPVLPHADAALVRGDELRGGGVLGQAVHHPAPRTVVQLGCQPALHQLPATHL